MSFFFVKASWLFIGGEQLRSYNRTAVVPLHVQDLSTLKAEINPFRLVSADYNVV